MGQALQVITGSVTNPSTTVTALTPNTGDSYTIRSTNMASEIELLTAWAFSATAGILRIRSPRMHDQAQNIREQVPVSQPRPLMSWHANQRLYSQDPIIVEMTGDAAAVDLATLAVYYHDLPGVSARLHHVSEVLPLVENLTTVQVTVTSSATSGAYSPTVALNANFDTLVRGVDYAILGYNCPITGGTLGITGVDTGNLRVGGPLYNQSEVTDDWFVLLSRLTNNPCIPVINSANVAGVNLDVACQATSTAFNIGVHLAELSRPLAGHG